MTNIFLFYYFVIRFVLFLINIVAYLPKYLIWKMQSHGFYTYHFFFLLLMMYSVGCNVYHPFPYYNFCCNPSGFSENYIHYGKYCLGLVCFSAVEFMILLGYFLLLALGWTVPSFLKEKTACSMFLALFLAFLYRLTSLLLVCQILYSSFLLKCWRKRIWPGHNFGCVIYKFLKNFWNFYFFGCLKMSFKMMMILRTLASFFWIKI